MRESWNCRSQLQNEKPTPEIEQRNAKQSKCRKTVAYPFQGRRPSLREALAKWANTLHVEPRPTSLLKLVLPEDWMNHNQTKTPLISLHLKFIW